MTVTVVTNPITITILVSAVITTPPTSAPTACAASVEEESIYLILISLIEKSLAKCAKTTTLQNV